MRNQDSGSLEDDFESVVIQSKMTDEPANEIQQPGLMRGKTLRIAEVSPRTEHEKNNDYPITNIKLRRRVTLRRQKTKLAK